MCNVLVCLCFLLLKVLLSDSVGVYHEGSKVTFLPDEVSEYFGYTVVLTESGIIVGAPKAASRVSKSVQTGLVFSCDFKDLKVKNVTCHPFSTTAGWSRRSMLPTQDLSRDDMWYGATVLPMQQEQLLVCAPRWKDWLNDRREHLLALGACFTQTGERRSKLVPLNEPSRNAYIIDGSRPEYGTKNAPINYYAYGQAGMSAKVVDDSRIIIGAPGLLMWTGGIVEYNYAFFKITKGAYFSKQPTSNPYYTRQLMPDDYFGYSVESGTFDNSSGILYVAGAPRSQMGLGGVLIFEPPTKETDPIRIRYRIQGPHLGSYFGATLCCTDLNGDGRSDLLVGAPTYTVKDGKLHFDQGGVLVYLSSGEGESLAFKQVGLVNGSKRSGARFGSAIADLGDVDGDGFRDIAIGAPFEDDGTGAVYIYRGDIIGIRPEFLQRITTKARGFGFSISKGYDVDGNNCNDLAIGAFNSASAFIYRCIPTAKVVASIKVPDVVDLAHNTTNFKVLFCVNVAKSGLWPKIQVDVKAKITVDNEEGRAMILGDDEYKVLVAAGDENCEEQVVEVKPTADLSKPISLNFNLEQIQAFNDSSSSFDTSAVRICEDSVLQTSFQIQLTRDCGEDLVCKPLLVMNLTLLEKDPYIPGSGSKLGVKVTILNKEEPAFGAKVYLTLPLPPKRLPETCTLKSLNVTCDVPAPLRRNEAVTWELELEYTQLYGVEESRMKVMARMNDPFFVEKILDSRVQEVVLRIMPVASFAVNGKPLPNITVPVSRQKFKEKSVVNVVHYYEIINYGPSDWMPLIAKIRLPKNVTLSNPVQGCEEVMEFVHCVWATPARVSLPIILTLRVDLYHHGNILEENNAVNITSSIYLVQHNKTAKIMSTLVLDPAPPVWPLVVGLAAGFIVLGVIVYGLYKYDFFSRQRRDRLRLLKELEVNELAEPGSSNPDHDHDPGLNPEADQSTEELLCDSD